LAGWILTVDQNYPQHVDYAVRHGFWDTTKQFPIEAGDDIFFWLTGPDRRLVAHFVATSSLGPMGSAPQPWDDAGVRTYLHRVDLELVSQDVLESPTWPELQDIIGNRQFPNTGVISIKRSEGVEVLSQMFARADIAWSPRIEFDLDSHDPDAGDYADLLDIPPDQDERESAIRAVVVRRGQPGFRKRLLATYRHCLVTRWRVPAVLEAAHISPYRGPHTNRLENGLLLRADVHTLFDLNLLTITPNYTIHVAPDLRSSGYGGFDGDTLSFPTVGRLRPDPDQLERHNANCQWL
jgi:hypothetical protein